MNKRRFFTGLMKAAAIVALAPQFAFGVQRSGYKIIANLSSDGTRDIAFKHVAYMGEWKWVSASGKEMSTSPVVVYAIPPSVRKRWS